MRDLMAPQVKHAFLDRIVCPKGVKDPKTAVAELVRVYCRERGRI